MKINAITATSLLVLAMSAPATAVFAQAVTSADTEMQALSAATVAATEAIATVEKTSGGKVVELSLDLEGATPGYRVSVVAADGVETTYLVDAASGAAILVLEDHSDQDLERNDDGEDGGDNENGDEENGSEGEATN